MPQVTIKDKRIFVDQTPVDLISGEFHYWRVDPDYWGPILKAIKDLDIQTISTYVSWQFHEVAEGHLDFYGETMRSRNLDGFLKEVKENGFWLLVRPGPFIHGETPNMGVPDRIYMHHRLDAYFQAETRAYVEQVAEVIRPYLATHGGPILAVQPDNEIECWDYLYEKELGLRGGDGLFQVFLRERYPSIEALNESWGTHYQGFEGAQGFNGGYKEYRTDRRRFRDALEFRSWYVARYAAWLTRTFKDVGIDVPIYFNGYKNFNKEQNLAQLAEIGDFAGPNLYPTEEFKGDPDEFRAMLEDLRYSKVYSAIPYISEMQAGNAHGMHYPRGLAGPRHYRMMAAGAILSGISSWTWYMLVNRDQWYGSPIDQMGRKPLELFEVYKQIVRAAHSMDLSDLKQLTSSCVAIHHLHFMDQTSTVDLSILRAFYDAGLDYEYYDLELGGPAKPLMFYAGATWLPGEEQQKLRSYVEAGGNLVFCQTTPREDEHLEPCDILGLNEPTRSVGRLYVRHFDTDLLVRLGGQSARVVNPAEIRIYEPEEGDLPIWGRRTPSVAFEDSSSEWARKMTGLACQEDLCVGYVRPLGKGKLIVLGVQPNAELISALHQFLGVPIPVRPIDAVVQTSLFAGKGSFTLVAVNNQTEAHRVLVQLDASTVHDGMYVCEDLFNQLQTSENIQKGRLIVTVPAKDGLLLRLTPQA